MEFAKKIHELEKQSESLEAELTEYKDKLESITSDIRETESWIRSFTELEAMFSDESKLYDKQQFTYNEMKNAEDDHKTASDKYERCKANSEILETLLGELNRSLGRTRDILAVVDDARETFVTEGELEILYSQYNSCISSMNESLKGLQNRLSSEQDVLRRSEGELVAYTCDEEEYRTVSYSSEQLRKVREERDRLDKEKEVCQSEFNSRNSKHGSAEESYKKAEESLVEYDGIPLPKDKIGDDFKTRINKANAEIKVLNDKIEKLSWRKYQRNDRLY